MHDTGCIIIFDGVCNLCNGWVNYIIKRDPEAVFSFAPMQSNAAKDLIEQHPETPFDCDTILLIKNGEVYTHSDAALEITRELSNGRMLHYLFRITPKPLRDALYQWVARNRYQLFGQRDECMVPTDDLRKRFLA